MPSCLVAGSDATSVTTSHQLLSLLHCHGKGVQYFLIGAMCSPGTLSSPKNCLANSRWQPARLTTTDGPTEADFLAGLPYSHFSSTPDLLYFCTGYCAFPEVAQGGFPCDCRGQNQPLRPMATVHQQSAPTQPMAFP